MSSDLGKLTHGWNRVEDDEIASLGISLYTMSHFLMLTTKKGKKQGQCTVE